MAPKGFHLKTQEGSRHTSRVWSKISPDKSEVFLLSSLVSPLAVNEEVDLHVGQSTVVDNMAAVHIFQYFGDHIIVFFCHGSQVAHRHYE